MNKLELFFIGAVDVASTLIVIAVLMTTLAMAHLCPLYNCCLFGCG